MARPASGMVRLPRQQLVGDVGGDAPRFVAQLGDELFVAGKSPHYISCKVPIVPTK